MLEEKVKQVFSDMIVLKEPKRSEFFSNLSLPSYMRDWLVMKFSDSQGNIDYDGTLSYIKKFIPDRDAYQVIKYRLMQGSTEKLLARVRLEVNLKKGVVQFELPDFGGARGGASGIVSDNVLEQYADVLLRESENLEIEASQRLCTDVLLRSYLVYLLWAEHRDMHQQVRHRKVHHALHATLPQNTLC